MNVYDFDKTIYNGDSSIDFYLFCLRKIPRLIVFLPVQIIGAMLYIIGVYDKDRFKEDFFSFLKGIKNIDLYVESFWEKNNEKIKNFYGEQKKENDVIISASPFFLIEPMCSKLGVGTIIATDVDKNTGKFLSKNCKGEEKVTRFYNCFGNVKVDKFYSDSLSDSPFAKISEKSYIVKNDECIPWNEYVPPKTNKFLSEEFLRFLIVGGINAINGIIFSYLASFVLQPNLAFVVGYLISLSISYVLNSKIVFRKNKSLNGFFKFCISYIPNFCIQNIFVFLFYNLLSWNKLVVYVLSALVGVPVTFLILKLFVFREKILRKH